MNTTERTALEVSCGNCLAPAGKPCVGDRGFHLRHPHRERIIWSTFVIAERARMTPRAAGEGA